MILSILLFVRRQKTSDGIYKAQTELYLVIYIKYIDILTK